MRLHFLFLSLAVVLIITGCQTQQARPSGYLVNYKHLKPVDSSGKTLYYEDKAAPWKSYHSIMFDEVIVKIAPGEAETDIDPEDLKRMRNYFQRALANNSCRQLAFTNKPGEGVILLRSAIVDIEPVNVAANIVSRGIFFVPVDFGEAAIEGELRDSVTGRHLASIVDSKIGSMIDPTHSYTTWEAVEDAFDSWGKQLGGLLEKNLKQMPVETK